MQVPFWETCLSACLIYWLHISGGRGYPDSKGRQISSFGFTTVFHLKFQKDQIKCSPNDIYSLSNVLVLFDSAHTWAMIMSQNHTPWPKEKMLSSSQKNYEYLTPPREPNPLKLEAAVLIILE